MQIIRFLIALLCATGPLYVCAHAPKVTVVFVIDQLSAHYLEKTQPFLKGGIGSLLKEGVHYTNAFYDASPPSTAHGHALLTTGTYGAFHGIVGNWWHTKGLTKMPCDEDSPKTSAVFALDGTTLPYGRSAKNMVVDNLSDQLMLHSYPHARNTVWSLSMKSRAAILMAGKMGKAVWLNDTEGSHGYTTSKAYFNELPDWIKNYNKKRNFNAQKKVTWKPLQDLCHPMYLFDDAANYTFSRRGKPLIGKTHALSQNKDFKSIYEKTPQATSDFFDFARECVNANYKKSPNERFILWLNVASLDKVSHGFGPYSRESLDTLYHIDKHMKKFIDFIYTKVPKEEALFVLTGDHGVLPIPELIAQKGYSLARRYIASTLIEEMNKLVEEKHGIKKFVQLFHTPQFYLDMSLIKDFTDRQKKEVIATLKQYLMSLPGIRKVWTFDELEKTLFEDYDLDRFIKKEIYRGRSGQLFFSADPYTIINEDKKGTTHSTPYAYDTRVPLVFHQAGRFSPQQIHSNKYMTQVSVTLASILNVPRPSAALANVLPELVA